MTDREKKINAWLSELIRTIEKLKSLQISSIMDVSKAAINSLAGGGKIILFGNGGSASDAQHIAAELVGRFMRQRKALAAVSLTTNTSVITALANDYGYENVFSRQIEALAGKNDIAIGISTSGDSDNVLKGLLTAKGIGLVTVALAGKGGGKISKVSDYSIIIPSDNTARIQEAHIAVGHILCELIEEAFI